METILSFLADLNRNNNREWFTENKKRYQEALEIFRDLINKTLTGVAEFDPSLGNLEAKDTIFRIYKDVRFSKDKTPYKTHFGSWMTKGGRKSTDAGYYIHLEPGGGSFIGGGVWMPPKEQLTLIRQEIIFNPDSYFKVVNPLENSDTYERTGKDDMLKKGPAGFAKDLEHLEEIKYKHYIFSRNYSDQEVKKKSFESLLIEDFKGLFPLVTYLNHAMSFTGNE